jgi:hypothetical protein
VIEVLRRRDQPADLVRAQHRREPAVAFRRREVLFQFAAFEDADKEEAQGRHVQPHGPDRELLLSKEVGLIPSERVGPELIETTPAVVAFTRPECVEVAPNRGRRVVTSDELVEQTLLKGGHRQYLL